MEDQKVISGSTEQEIWTQIEADLPFEGDLLNYDVLIDHNGKQVELYIDIDLGGGFEGGSELTQLSAPLNVPGNFRFALHDEDFLDTIGKFFGLEDIKLGYPELDEHVVVKTNEPQKIHQIFVEQEVREVFTDLEDFDFGIYTHTLPDNDVKQTFLELNINQGITNLQNLRKIYHAFFNVLTALEG